MAAGDNLAIRDFGDDFLQGICTKTPKRWTFFLGGGGAVVVSLLGRY